MKRIPKFTVACTYFKILCGPKSFPYSSEIILACIVTTLQYVEMVFFGFRIHKLWTNWKYFSLYVNFHIFSYSSHHNRKDCPCVNSSSSQVTELLHSWKPQGGSGNLWGSLLVEILNCNSWSNLQSVATSGIRSWRNWRLKFWTVMNTTSGGADTLWKKSVNKIVSLFLLTANWSGCETLFPISRHEMVMAREENNQFLEGELHPVL